MGFIYYAFRLPGETDEGGKFENHLFKQLEKLCAIDHSRLLNTIQSNTPCNAMNPTGSTKITLERPSSENGSRLQLHA